MAVGPETDPIPLQGFTKQTSRNVAGTVLDVVKASAGSPVAIGLICIENTSGATAFVQFFNAKAANVTLSSTMPDLEVPVAATTGFQVITFPTAGGGFPNGFSYASTTASEGSSASSSGVRVTVFYR